MKAGWAYFVSSSKPQRILRNFPNHAHHAVLSIGGEKSLGDALANK